MEISTRLIDHARPLCQENPIQDVRIGLGYTYVELADGKGGLAWTPNSRHGGSCTQLGQAGDLLALTEQELLQWLDSSVHLERALGLAVFNALNARQERHYLEQESIALLELQATDKVVMVGHFAPLIQRITQSGCHLDILDLETDKPGLIDLRQGPEVLADCDVAIITATSLINNTLEGLLTSLQRARAAVLLGPSTPVCPEVFAQTPITQLSGVLVHDNHKTKEVISQGGGTMRLKRYLRFVSHAA